jgi:hypothetical protein
VRTFVRDSMKVDDMSRQQATPVAILSALYE